MTRRVHQSVLLGLVALWAAATTAQELKLPLAEGSVRFAVIGDSGTGGRSQYQVAEQMARYHKVFPFEFVLMLGDNMYGTERPQDYQRKFETPYKPLLDAKVQFYASLGNHDDPNQKLYKPFNMNGEQYYTFKKGSVRFFVLDSNYFDQRQRDWLERELSASTDPWKISYFHHPVYSSGARHGSEVDLRAQLEPLFIKHGVSVVFAGHEHFYERLKPQNGIHYFICGGSAKLRKGNIRRGALHSAGFDTDMSFMIVEVVDDRLSFQTISRTGATVDAGTVDRVIRPQPTTNGR
jgi:predicted phosphodiesterase